MLILSAFETSVRSLLSLLLRQMERERRRECALARRPVCLVWSYRSSASCFLVCVSVFPCLSLPDEFSSSSCVVSVCFVLCFVLFGFVFRVKTGEEAPREEGANRGQEEDDGSQEKRSEGGGQRSGQRREQLGEIGHPVPVISLMS